MRHVARMAIVPNDISAEIAYSDLKRIVYENGEPWSSVAQCDLYLRAAGMYRDTQSAEAEKDGLRISKRDIESSIVECRKARAALLFTCQPATVIVPPDELR